MLFPSGIIRVKILGAKDLPVMDRASDLTDAFVEVMKDRVYSSFIYLIEELLSAFAMLISFNHSLAIQVSSTDDGEASVRLFPWLQFHILKEFIILMKNKVL